MSQVEIHFGMKITLSHYIQKGTSWHDQSGLVTAYSDNCIVDKKRLLQTIWAGSYRQRNFVCSNDYGIMRINVMLLKE